MDLPSHSPGVVRSIVIKVSPAATVLALLLSPLAAQNSTLVHTVTVTTNFNPDLDGLEIGQRIGISTRPSVATGTETYWWRRGFGSGEFTSADVFGYKSALPRGISLNPGLGSASNLVEFTPRIGGATKDGSYGYFTATVNGLPGLYRKPLSAGPGEAPQRLAGIIAGGVVSPGAVTRYEGDVYFSPIYTDGSCAVWRAAFNGDGNYIGSGVVADGILPTASAVRKIVLFRDNFEGPLRTYGLILQDDRRLYRFGPINGGGGTNTLTFLASGVGDIIARREKFLSGFPFLSISHLDRIYGVTDSTTIPGRFFQVNMTGNTIMNLYDDRAGRRFNAVGADANFLFVSRSGANNSNPEIIRSFNPADTTVIGTGSLRTDTIPGNDRGWVSLENRQALNLRSDDRWLYFTSGNAIRRVSTTAPPLITDIQALGVEATQIVQNLNNTIRLIAGKPATVRGYARLALDYSAQRFPSARLTVFHNNTAIASLDPYASPVVDATAFAPLSGYRGNPDRSFLFDVPGTLVRAGTMRFEMNVNPSLAILENAGASPYANNVASTPGISTVDSGMPELVFCSMNVGSSSAADDYYFDTDRDGFWKIVARARSLLPISDFRVGISSLHVSKPVIVFLPFPRVRMRAFDMTSQSDALLNWLRFNTFLESLVSDRNYVGMVHPQIERKSGGGIFNGIGSRPGNHLVVRMDSGPARDTNGIRISADPWTQISGGTTLAHELGHNFNQKHIDQTKAGCGGPAPDDPNDAYVYNKCMIGPATKDSAEGIFGFDPLTGSVIDGTQVGDLMTYHYTRWTSDYTLNRLLVGNGWLFQQRARLLNGGGGASTVFFIGGTVDSELGIAEFWPGHCVPAEFHDPAAVSASITAGLQPASHGYRIRQTDAAGGVLSEATLQLTEGVDDSEARPGFVQFLAADPETVALEIVRNGSVLSRLAATANAPTVTPGDPVMANGILSWNWEVFDLDGDLVFSTVQISRNGGASWETLRTPMPDTSLALSTTMLPGTGNAKLRVIVSDGFHGSSAESEPFSLPGHEPLVSVGGLRENQRVPFGRDIVLTGEAYDPEDGKLDSSGISWTLDGPFSATRAGAGWRLECLPAGAYQITCSATDADRMTGSAVLNFQVTALAIPELASAPLLDGEPSEALWASAVEVCFPASLATRASARVFRHGGMVYFGISDLPKPTIAGFSPANISIAVDNNASGETSPQAGDFIFRVDADGHPSQFEGNGTAFVGSANPAAGVVSVVAPSISGWTAEICVPESALGGANHPVRLAVGLSTPFFSSNWPIGSSLSNPSSWGTSQVGTLPPVENLPPLAHAGPDVVLDPSEFVTISLDGSTSSDPEDQPLRYEWTQVAGPSVTLANASTVAPSFSLGPVSSPTEFTFSLTVNDGEVDSAPDRITFRVRPVAPASEPMPLDQFSLKPDGTSIAYFDINEPFVEEEGADAEIASGPVFPIESSDDLINWRPLTTATPDFLGRLAFGDEIANLERQFYRYINPAAYGLLAPGTALSFNGQSGQLVSIATRPALNGYPLTVIAWLRSDDSTTSGQGVVSKYADNLNGWALFLSDGRLRGWYFRDSSNYVWNGGLGLDAGFIADGAWHQIALVVSPTGGTIFVDAIKRANLPWTGTPGPSTSGLPVQIGRYAGYATSFSGEIDEVSIWSKALNNFDLQDLRRKGPAEDEADLISLWQCDEGSGTTLGDSKSGYDGTLIGPGFVESTAPIRR